MNHESWIIQINKWSSLSTLLHQGQFLSCDAKLMLIHGKALWKQEMKTSRVIDFDNSNLLLITM